MKYVTYVSQITAWHYLTEKQHESKVKIAEICMIIIYSNHCQNLKKNIARQLKKEDKEQFQNKKLNCVRPQHIIPERRHFLLS